MGDSIELTAAYKRLALACAAWVTDDAYVDPTASDGWNEIVRSTIALRALLAPERDRSLVDDLRDLRVQLIRDDWGEYTHEIKTIDRAIAAMEGSK